MKKRKENFGSMIDRCLPSNEVVCVLQLPRPAYDHMVMTHTRITIVNKVQVSSDSALILLHFLFQMEGKLSLVAAFDDLMRCATVLNTGCEAGKLPSRHARILSMTFHVCTNKNQKHIASIECL